tara:strand:+ start:2438 stop:3592 length:1155 start_codon:yes stop_codon:yes gene_type:complete
MKKIGILGSTGSVGTQTLEVIDRQAEKYKVLYLTAKSNAELLCKQAKKYNVEAICILDKSKYSYCKNKLSDIKIFIGRKGLLKIASINKIDLMINALVGGSGMEPTVNAIRSGVDIALSNKESMVMAGSYINKLCKNNNVNIFPMDSEHSAIWQCLKGEQYNQINKLILTGSGGPFRTKSIKDFRKIKKEDALKHPNWEMGRKITIDSATMMNKGLEVIEAYWLFNIPIEKIEIIIHPQSIIHSLVEFVDGSIKAQLGVPDMKIPIQYALSYPNHDNVSWESLNLSKIKTLTFESPDLEKFPCIRLAYEAINKGGSYPVVLNIANDIAVELFLNNNIKFINIPEIIEIAMKEHSYIQNPDLNDIEELTKQTKNFISYKIEKDFR